MVYTELLCGEQRGASRCAALCKLHWAGRDHAPLSQQSLPYAAQNTH